MKFMKNLKNCPESEHNVVSKNVGCKEKLTTIFHFRNECKEKRTHNELTRKFW
jgi:hypothetical protein